MNTKRSVDRHRKILPLQWHYSDSLMKDTSTMIWSFFLLMFPMSYAWSEIEEECPHLVDQRIFSPSFQVMRHNHSFNSYSANYDNWCTATLWNRIMTVQCEGMGEVGSARYEPTLLPPCPSIRALSYSNCQRSTHSNIQACQFKC